MFRAAISLFAAVFALIGTASAALAEKRVALVIGNSAYKHTSELLNPKNDASDISVALARLGFQVIDGTDLPKRDMERRIREFSNALDGADVGLFFYAGHGLQVGGKNYLAPIDAELRSESDLDFEAVELNLVLRQMERNAKVNLVFLDACRDNPLASVLARSLKNRGRSSALGRGLARVEEAVGMMIAFATQPGNIALDGEGRNSPFTTALLEHIGTPGASINDVMIGVRNSVLASTNGKQVPWENSSLTGQFYFNPGGQAAASTRVASVDPAPVSPASTKSSVSDSDFDLTFWTSIRDSDNPALFQEYLRRFPDGAFTPIAEAKIKKHRAIAVEEKTETPKKVEGVKTAELTKTSTADVQAPADTKVVPEVDAAAAKIANARSVQTALKKLGCYTSSIDGIWGNGSQSAMRRFNSTAKMNLPVGPPDATTLAIVEAWRGKRCAVVVKRKSPPKTTRSRTVKKKTTTRKQPTRTTQRRRPPPPPPPSSGPPPGGGGGGTVIIGGGSGGGRSGISIGIIGGGLRF